MTFQDFEKILGELDFGIVGMNHYWVDDKRHLFCAVLSKDGKRAIKAEGNMSSSVFETIVSQIAS